jgi:ankyrin repeat protein
MIRLLIENGIDLNTQDYFGETALHKAIVEPNSDIIELLLSRGADPYIQNQRGETPMYSACEFG